MVQVHTTIYQMSNLAIKLCYSAVVVAVSMSIEGSLRNKGGSCDQQVMLKLLNTEKATRQILENTIRILCNLYR